MNTCKETTNKPELSLVPKQKNIEAEAITNDPKERLLYVAGYQSCLENLKQWLLDNDSEHISSVYNFLGES